MKKDVPVIKLSQTNKMSKIAQFILETIGQTLKVEQVDKP